MLLLPLGKHSLRRWSVFFGATRTDPKNADVARWCRGPRGAVPISSHCYWMFNVVVSCLEIIGSCWTSCLVAGKAFGARSDIPQYIASVGQVLQLIKRKCRGTSQPPPPTWKHFLSFVSIISQLYCSCFPDGLPKNILHEKRSIQTTLIVLTTHLFSWFVRVSLPFTLMSPNLYFNFSSKQDLYK